MVVETIKNTVKCDESTVEYVYGLSERAMTINGKKLIVYGVEAKSYLSENGERKECFCDAIDCLTPDKQKAREFIHMIKENGVSPIHLLDIAETKIDDFYKEFDVKYIY